MQNRLSTNIRALRKFYGESQEELGLALECAKNTISSYETGQREPNHDVMNRLADHFQITVEELLHQDYSSIAQSSWNYSAYTRHIQSIVPSIQTTRALENKQFRRAYESHQALLRQIQKNGSVEVTSINKCLNEYSIVPAEDNDLSTVVIINTIGLFLLRVYVDKSAASAAALETAQSQYLSKKEHRFKVKIEDARAAVDTEKAALYSTNLRKEIPHDILNRLLASVKSSQWSDLADYYIALRYVWDLVPNQLSSGMNRRVGSEMLSAFSSVGNQYAKNHLHVMSMIIHSKSSQTVDD